MATVLFAALTPGNAQNAVKPDTASASIGSAEARIIPPAPSYHFPDGKNLVYGVEWHAFNAGTATIQVRPDGTTEKLSAVANSVGAVNLFFPVHDWFEAHFDPKTFCSTRVFKHSEEGKRKREVQIQIDYERRKSVLDEKNLKTGETRHEENDTPACATDIVSGFFYVASLPLQTGSVFYFPVIDGGKTSAGVVRVEGRDQVKVPAGTFPAIRVSIEAASGKLQGKGKLLVWFSDDAEHLPLQMQGKMGWGTVMFKLQKLTGQEENCEKCSTWNTVERSGMRGPKQLISLGTSFVTVIKQGVRLCKKHLLSRTLNTYESRLDLTDSMTLRRQ